MTTPGIKINGEKLRTARLRRRLTQAQVAQAAGVSHMHYLRVENEQKNPSAALLDRLATIFGSDTIDTVLHPDGRAIYEPR